MSNLTVFCRKGDTHAWKLVEKVYGIIKSLEDGCTSTDVVDLLDDPRDKDRVSNVVSWLTLSLNAPVTSERTIEKYHKNLQVVAPLPDVLYDNPERQKRTSSTGAKFSLDVTLQKMTRTELLKLKIQINELLAAKS